MDQFLKAVYDQIYANLKSGGVAQGSNFWNLYTVGIGADDPYTITLADGSTMGVIAAHVRSMFYYASRNSSVIIYIMLRCVRIRYLRQSVLLRQTYLLYIIVCCCKGFR